MTRVSGHTLSILAKALGEKIRVLAATAKLSNETANTFFSACEKNLNLVARANPEFPDKVTREDIIQGIIRVTSDQVCLIIRLEQTGSITTTNILRRILNIPPVLVPEVYLKPQLDAFINTKKGKEWLISQRQQRNVLEDEIINSAKSLYSELLQKGFNFAGEPKIWSATLLYAASILTEHRFTQPSLAAAVNMGPGNIVGYFGKIKRALPEKIF